MSNILTDIMGFFKRKKYETDPKDHDVLVIGVHDKPDMTGIASPKPPKDARLITVKILEIHVNAAIGLGKLQKQVYFLVRQLYQQRTQPRSHHAIMLLEDLSHLT